MTTLIATAFAYYCYSQNWMEYALLIMIYVFLVNFTQLCESVSTRTEYFQLAFLLPSMVAIGYLVTQV